MAPLRKEEVGAGMTDYEMVPSAFPTIDALPSAAVSIDHLSDNRIFGFLNADMRARPFKLLRAQLRKLMQASGAKLVGITSPSPGVGKSFVASNLATAMSRVADTDVYLIDIDLRRPALAPRFGIEERPGLQDYLSGVTSNFADIAVRVNEERLALVPSFERGLASAELLASKEADTFFKAVRALPETAIAIFDMPPIFADDDAVITSERLDGVLVVVEDGLTTRKQVQETIRLLHPTPCYGTVLNRYKTGILDDDYGYGGGYGYGVYYGTK
jgi:Mrp family chromosome partitioning ATPase